MLIRSSAYIEREDRFTSFINVEVPVTWTPSCRSIQEYRGMVSLKKEKKVQSGSSLNMRSNLHLIPGESFEMTSGVCNLCLVKSFLIWMLHKFCSPVKLCWNVWGFCCVALQYRLVLYASFNWHTYLENLLNWDVSWGVDVRPVVLNTHNFYLTGP